MGVPVSCSSMATGSAWYGALLTGADWKAATRQAPERVHPVATALPKHRDDGGDCSAAACRAGAEGFREDTKKGRLNVSVKPTTDLR